MIKLMSALPPYRYMSKLSGTRQYRIARRNRHRPRSMLSFVQSALLQGPLREPCHVVYTVNYRLVVGQCDADGRAILYTLCTAW